MRFIVFAISFALHLSASQADIVRAPSSAEVDRSFTIDWADFSDVHDTVVTRPYRFPASDGGTGVLAYSEGRSDLTIHDGRGLFLGTGATLISTQQDDTITLFCERGLQGIGATIEHLESISATYRLRLFDTNGFFIDEVTVPSPGSAGNPAFIGAIDPDSRIVFAQFSAIPNSRIALTNPNIQLSPNLPEEVEELPNAR